MQTRKETLVAIFRDTVRLCTENPQLLSAVKASIQGTKYYPPSVTIKLPSREGKGNLSINQFRSFEAAQYWHKAYPHLRIGVLNFASATRPGGGVEDGCTAQEECLCRCSSLFLVLNQDELHEKFYNTNAMARNPLYSDACIYSPGIMVFKTDERCPQLMNPDDWFAVDIITCAAPDLRVAFLPTENELYQIHVSRANRVFQVAIDNGIDIMIMGAFGCGAFENDPIVVAKAHRDAIASYRNHFYQIEYAIYSRSFDTKNYDIFRGILFDNVK